MCKESFFIAIRGRKISFQACRLAPRIPLRLLARNFNCMRLRDRELIQVNILGKKSFRRKDVRWDVFDKRISVRRFAYCRLEPLAKGMHGMYH